MRTSITDDEHGGIPETAPAEAPGSSLRLLDIFLPASGADAESGRRMRERAFVLIALAIVANAAVLVGAATLTGRSWMASDLMVAVAGFTLALLVGMRLGTPVEIVGQSLMAILYCAGVGLTLATGGQAIGAAAVTAAIPLVALALLGRRSSIFLACAVALGFVATTGLRRAGARSMD